MFTHSYIHTVAEASAEHEIAQAEEKGKNRNNQSYVNTYEYENTYRPPFKPKLQQPVHAVSAEFFQQCEQRLQIDGNGPYSPSFSKALTAVSAVLSLAKNKISTITATTAVGGGGTNVKEKANKRKRRKNNGGSAGAETDEDGGRCGGTADIGASKAVETAEVDKSDQHVQQEKEKEKEREKDNVQMVQLLTEYWMLRVGSSKYRTARMVDRDQEEKEEEKSRTTSMVGKRQEEEEKEEEEDDKEGESESESSDSDGNGDSSAAGEGGSDEGSMSAGISKINSSATHTKTEETQGIEGIKDITDVEVHTNIKSDLKEPKSKPKQKLPLELRVNAGRRGSGHNSGQEWVHSAALRDLCRSAPWSTSATGATNANSIVTSTAAGGVGVGGGSTTTTSSAATATNVNKEVGRWGEALVYQHLLQRYPDAVSVEWVNEQEESLACYDLKLLLREKRGANSNSSNCNSNGNGNNGRVITTFIEVKSSRFEHLNAFQLSLNEWEFAVGGSSGVPRPNYDIYRVYNAGDPERVSVRVVRGVYEAVRKGDAQLCLAI